MDPCLLASFVFRHACYLICLLSLPYRDGRRHLQSCKDHKLAIKYIHTLHVYIPAYIHGLAPVRALLSPAFPSLPFSSLAAHRPNYMEGSSSSRLAIVAIRRVSHNTVCMYVSMFAYMNVYNMHLCLMECMCYLVQVMSEGLGQPTNDWSQWAGEDATLPSSEPTPPSPIKQRNF